MKKDIISTRDLIIVIVVALTLTFLEAFSQSLLAKFHLINTNAKHYKLLHYPFISWLIYGCCVVLLTYAYQFGNLGLVEVFWNTGTNTIIPLVGVLLFNQSLTTSGWIGVAITTLGGVVLGLAEIGKI